MANRLYNKQVSPKGYQKGGSVKQSPMGSSSTKGNILRGKLKSQKELKKITDSKKYKDASYGEKTKMLNVATMKKGGRIRKMGGGMMMKRPMMKEGGKLKMVMKGGKKVPFFAADGKGAKDLGKAAMKKGGIAKLNPGLKAFMKKKMAKKK